MSDQDITLQERPEPEGSVWVGPALESIPDDSATQLASLGTKIHSGSRSAKVAGSNRVTKGCLNVRKNSVLRRSEGRRRQSNLVDTAISGRRQSSSANQSQQVSFSGESSETPGEYRQSAPKSSLWTRRMTWTAAQIPTSKKSNESNSRRGSIMVNKGQKNTDPSLDPVTGLSRQQIKAFKEVFDLFDCNGGGTIDAEDLDGALRSVNICLTKAEIKEVLHTMDQDGSGQVDFNEFLQMMTNTERFIEMLDLVLTHVLLLILHWVSLASSDGETRAQNHHLLLFEALTAFMKKCALKSMEAIVGYYQNKYQKADASSYVNHYAAGERLIGLNEKQLKEHLENMVKATPKTKGTKCLSPYAQPLNIVMSKTANSRKSNKTRIRGRIRLKVRHTDSAVKASNESTASSNKSLRNPHKIIHQDDLTTEVGWVSQRTEHIEVKLPYQFLKPFQPFDELTAEDLPTIRGQVNAAFREYRLERRHTQVHDGIHHWVALEPELISPKSLRKNFRGVFSTYTDIDTRYLPLHSTQI